ncbi:ABC transporter ATP-binding protein [Roseomonas marmotae]|uniref:ABC transporter ATP-binding protein n=1 Tax=Roseomonas marmotae TaxID=2768161 RepID=A0ABS3KAX9_9PROT|nr:ABC transporter ATP-binding protein [Roseomonas marmotae]MBO1074595.1 ABC transporter ATP-binding protein [Roseomonas marmotae]QTI81622.1 ABC transporter ATP-binding protein [Roseomonas marmotae]
MPELVLSHVTRRFSGHTAVDDLSLTVRDGEFVCLLGPSGCGKTTTLRIIAGFERADAGRLTLDGADITHLPPEKREIGLVFQSYALFPHKTIAENIGFGLKMRGRPRAEIDRAVEEALALVRLEGLGGRYPRALSGGQQQRVALARALAIHPRLLLMDEPLSNLDAQLREEMRNEIRRIQQSLGITAVLVTHDQSEALAMADRIAVMAKGRLQQMASPAEIYEAPATAFVGGFIGQVNALDGMIESADARGAVLATANGLRLAGQGTDLAPGAGARAMVKQERLSLTRAEPVQLPNRFPCRVAERTYLGGSIAYRCEAAGLSLTALLPNHPLFESFAPGDEGWIGWAAADCAFFPR